MLDRLQACQEKGRTMIKAVIFDLDGTLVQTEKLKARSYARAAVELCPNELSEQEVVGAFKDVVGLSRREVATKLVERFGLEQRARERMDDFGVGKPWQSYVQLRLAIYNDMLADPETILNNRWERAIALLERVRARGCKTGLATMSHCEQTRRVLNILGLNDAFGFVATRDDVDNAKPDPEIYHLVMKELGERPETSLVIEDSPAGVEAALSAGTTVIAVSTPFTRERLHALDRLPKNRIVDERDELMKVVEQLFDDLEDA